MDYQPKKLSNQPLVLVLAEFRFSEVLSMAEYIPAIQDRLRKHFPLPEKREQQKVDVAPGGIKIGSSVEWLFRSADERSAIIVGGSRMVFITAEYDRFPGFHERSMSALQVLNDVVEPTLLFRVGLRYSDYIAPDDADLSSQELDQCVAKHLLPDDNFKSLGQTNYHLTETSVVTNKGVLLIRSHCGAHGQVVMPDLASNASISLEVTGDTNRVAMILDFDHYWASENKDSPFSIKRASEKLEDLHEGTRAAFWRATTDYGREKIWI